MSQYEIYCKLMHIQLNSLESNTRKCLDIILASKMLGLFCSIKDPLKGGGDGNI